MSIQPTIKDFFAKITEYHLDQAPPVESASSGLKAPPIGEEVGLGTGQGEERDISADGNNDLAKAASWIFGMIKDAGSALYRFITQQGSNEHQTKLDEDKAEIEKLKSDMTNLEQSHPELHGALSEIINKHVEHLEEKSNRTRNISLLSGSGLACLAAGAVAALFVIKWLFTAAIIVGLGIAAFSIYHYIKNPEQPGEVKSLIEKFQFKQQMV